MSDPSISRNRDKRESVMMRALLWREGACSPGEHRVRNLSLSGVCIADPGRLRRGDAVRVTIGQATEMDAVVMWATHEAAGLRFAQPADLAARAAAARRAHPPARAGSAI